MPTRRRPRGRHHGRPRRRDCSGAPDDRSSGRCRRGAVRLHLPGVLRSATVVRRDDLFITLLLGQMYTLLNTFTDAVLVLRLEETAAGATIGVAVSVFVLPTGTRATARAARSGFLHQLADLLEGCADHLRLDRDTDLLALTVGLDAWGRQVVNTYRAVARGGLIGVDRGRLRHRLSLLGACGAHARALAAVVTVSGTASADLGTACSDLAAQSRRLADLGALPAPSELASEVTDARERVTSLVAVLADDDPRARPAGVEIGRVADALALLAAP